MVPRISYYSALYRLAAISAVHPLWDHLQTTQTTKAILLTSCRKSLWQYEHRYPRTRVAAVTFVLNVNTIPTGWCCH